MDIKEKIKQINWRQPKFMLPAILYIPLMGGSYFIFDLFHAEKAEIPDKTLQMPKSKTETESEANMRTWQSHGVKYKTIPQ